VVVQTRYAGIRGIVVYAGPGQNSVRPYLKNKVFCWGGERAGEERSMAQVIVLLPSKCRP
jgi:hypothetical protein